jgi:hypothetical protein
MKHLGFEFREMMSGSYTRSGAGGPGGGQMRLTARASAPSLLRHLQDGLAQLDGTLDMEGFADDVPVSGTLEIRPLTKKLIRYQFSFVGNDGNPYQFAGQKDIRLADLAGTITTLAGAVTDAQGTEVARATLRFDVKADLVAFLTSWRPAWG